MTAVRSAVPALPTVVPAVPSSKPAVPARVRLPVTVLLPMELPGAQVAPEATVTVLPAPMLMVPMPPSVWPLAREKAVRAVRFRTVPVEPVEPTTMLVLARLALAPSASVPAVMVVAPV